MGSWIPLSKMCVGNVVATPDQYGAWCWTVDGTDWRYDERQGLRVEVFVAGAWRLVGNVGTLNHAVAFALGWRARNQFPAELSVTPPANECRGESEQTTMGPA